MSLNPYTKNSYGYTGTDRDVNPTKFMNTENGLEAVTNQCIANESAIGTINGKIGTTDISGIGDGKITGAIHSLNVNLTKFKNIKVGTVTIPIGSTQSHAIGGGGVNIDVSDKIIIGSLGCYHSGSTNNYIPFYIIEPTSGRVDAQFYNNNSSAVSLTVYVRYVYIDK